MLSLLQEFTAFLASRGMLHRAYLVGGSVRDLLIGREFRDVDVAVEGDALTLGRAFAAACGGSFVLLDEDFSIARTVRAGDTLDISALRCNSLDIDLSERDFTINAMAIPIAKLEAGGPLRERFVIDPFAGRADLRKGIVNMVCEENFVKDPLRLLRAYRMSVTLGYKVEERTRGAIASLSPMICLVAAERVSEELRKILSCPESSDTVADMADTGLLASLFPHLKRDSALSRYCALEETLRRYGTKETVAYFSEPYRFFCLKLSALFETVSEAREACEQLKLSRKEQDLTVKLVEHRSVLQDLFIAGRDADSAETVKSLSMVGDDIHALAALFMAEAGTDRTSVSDYCNKIVAFYLGAFLNRKSLLPLVTGDDLINEFGLKASPVFKVILSGVDDLVLQGRVRTRKEALKAVEELARRFLSA